MKTKKKRRDKWHIGTTLVIIAIFAFFIYKAIDTSSLLYPENSAERTIEDFAKDHGLSLSDYPQSLIDLLERNPETEDFVLNYPLLKDAKPAFSMEEYIDTSSVPLFMQWDKRWGYTEYGADVLGLTGCGPTCLSMVAVYLLDDTTYDPAYMAEFSIDNGYCVVGNGTAWALMSDGASALGLDVTEIPLDEQRIIDNLEVDNPIICIMGPGDFTSTGHFIVMTGYEDGKIVINDPNSRENSEKLWKYDDIKDQIRNLWVYR
ncbi:MAG: hypothetical protein E7456_06630 [Ruminococcaceae bacterium]|nr:hypothetical protein [Oscillospiraceae bacterium]